MQSTDNPEELAALPKLFFKPLNAKRRRLINNQLRHITKGCLSDPQNFSLHRPNPKTQKMLCCRGTPSCENVNLQLLELAGKSIGIGRADRVALTFFEINNDRKKVSRQGEQTPECFTYCQEKLAIINGLAIEAGFKEDELPFNVSMPSKVDDIKSLELGFDLSAKLPTGDRVGDLLELQETIVEEANNDTEEEAGEQSTQAGTDDNNSVSGESDDGSLAEFVDDIDFDENRIEMKVTSLLPEIRHSESTMEAFQRLTDQQPHVPFHLGNDTTPMTELDKLEATLFDCMQVDYKRNVSPREPGGYFSFKEHWNAEVARRYRAKIEGEDGITLINRKSVLFLQEQYDRIQNRQSTSRRVDTQSEGNDFEALTNSLAADRRTTVARLPPVEEAQPIQYVHHGPAPIGNPMTVNPEVVAGAMQINQVAVRTQVPWQIPNRLQEPAPTNPLKGFKKYTWCITCGFRKGDHNIGKERFGRPCQRTYCGYCYDRKEFHADGKMGPLCQRNPHPTNSQQRFWYGGNN